MTETAELGPFAAAWAEALRTARSRPTCGQCAQPWESEPCGALHAVVASEPVVAVHPA
jgi:hypothetical protein